MIDPLWANKDRPDHVFCIDVPVGSDLILPIKFMDGFFQQPSNEQVQTALGELARALVNVKKAERSLIRYADAIRRAARIEIASARAEGLDLLLDGIGLKPAYAYHLSVPSWKDAAGYILAIVGVRYTCHALHHQVLR